MPIIRVRLDALAGLVSFPEIWAARLTVLTFLHDFGKANLGFQHRNAGHIQEAAFIACDSARRHEFGLRHAGQLWPADRLPSRGGIGASWRAARFDQSRTRRPKMVDRRRSRSTCHGEVVGRFGERTKGINLGRRSPHLRKYVNRHSKSIKFY
jgi:hypothetical protein